MTPTVFPPALLAEPALPGWLVQALLVFFFLVLPIIRGIRESLAKKKELANRRADAGPEQAEEPDATAQMDEARRRWEAMLRGEETAPPAAPAVPPAIPVSRPKASDIVPPAQLAGTLTDMKPAPNEDDVETTTDEATADPEHFIPDEETRAVEENDRRLREEREARTDFLRRERETGAGRRANVTSDPMTSLGAPTAAATIQRAVRPDVLFGDLADAKTRRVALRRAIVAAEVLGPPVALRDPATGPVGLRRPA
ncbi:MAG: hypothetical protein NTY35_00535 [Planctomycetota bacterium]|nr:hypothetical protein [Planctomycetota bacterium]